MTSLWLPATLNDSQITLLSSAGRLFSTSYFPNCRTRSTYTHALTPSMASCGLINGLLTYKEVGVWMPRQPLFKVIQIVWGFVVRLLTQHEKNLSLSEDVALRNGPKNVSKRTLTFYILVMTEGELSKCGRLVYGV